MYIRSIISINVNGFELFHGIDIIHYVMTIAYLGSLTDLDPGWLQFPVGKLRCMGQGNLADIYSLNFPGTNIQKSLQLQGAQRMFRISLWSNVMKCFQLLAKDINFTFCTCINSRIIKSIFKVDSPWKTWIFWSVQTFKLYCLLSLEASKRSSGLKLETHGFILA